MLYVWVVLEGKIKFLSLSIFWFSFFFLGKYPKNNLDIHQSSCVLRRCICWTCKKKRYINLFTALVAQYLLYTFLKYIFTWCRLFFLYSYHRRVKKLIGVFLYTRMVGFFVVVHNLFKFFLLTRFAL